MNWIAAIVVVCLPVTAVAERIWCGTSLDVKAPIWSRTRAPVPLVTRVERVHVADERDPHARSILAGAAGECGRARASWSVTLVVAPSGTVVEAHAVGAQASCVRDSLRRLQFTRGGVRTISAQLTLARE